ncbi:hypothetical protein BacF7301_06085 [Bacteroides faecium]|uniref:Uncharacterized protein n=1 Tax=Bacteroides faecium TaxID=2715212 RepID=A0A6H0KW75_9BACE|nr:hypothetical protein [Bacteroides faecium]QIU97429.1 hypothetical protein BacF7301_06085 [Bacteroides faecium]
MSIHYDLYETPDIQQTGEQQPLHSRVFSKGRSEEECLTIINEHLKKYPCLIRYGAEKQVVYAKAMEI